MRNYYFIKICCDEPNKLFWSPNLKKFRFLSCSQKTKLTELSKKKREIKIYWKNKQKYKLQTFLEFIMYSVSFQMFKVYKQQSKFRKRNEIKNFSFQTGEIKSQNKSILYYFYIRMSQTAVLIHTVVQYETRIFVFNPPPPFPPIQKQLNKKLILFDFSILFIFKKNKIMVFIKIFPVLTKFNVQLFSRFFSLSDLLI